jgi:hypothetical protein
VHIVICDVELLDHFCGIDGDNKASRREETVYLSI